jgi:restriction endonuclease S subunit
MQIPILNEEIRNQISKKIQLGIEKNNQSHSLYRQAEELLLETIGLKDFTPSEKGINIKSFKESFLATGRLDAEYYQPKYEEMIKYIERFETERLNRIVSIKKSIEPGSDAYETEGIPFIRVANVSKFGLTGTDIYLDKSKFGNSGLQPKKDTILLSKDGTVGIAYKIEQDTDIITSGALLHLTVTNKDFLPDYVTLVLNSEVVKMQAERDAGGSIIQHWKPSEIEQVVIPKISMEIQQQISALIQEVLGFGGRWGGC